MQLKNLKKTIRQHIFNFNINNFSFVIFEVRRKITAEQNKKNFCSAELFPKKIFNRLNAFRFKNLKFPNQLKLVFVLEDILTLTEISFTHSIFLIKVQFFFMKKNVLFFKDIFLSVKNLILLNGTLVAYLKKRILLKL